MEPCRPILKFEKKTGFDEKEITDIFRKANALANPIRLKIIKLLLEHGELCVCEIENALGLKQSKVSYHLASLIDGGYIKRKQNGPWSFYSLDGNAKHVLEIFALK